MVFKPKLLLIGSPPTDPVATSYYEPCLAEPENVSRALLPPLPNVGDAAPPDTEDTGQSDLLARLHQVYPFTTQRGWSVWVVNRLEPLLVLLTMQVQNCMDLFDLNGRLRHPWVQFGVILTWVYCGVRWLRTRPQTQAPLLSKPDPVSLPEKVPDGSHAERYQTQPDRHPAG